MAIQGVLSIKDGFKPSARYGCTLPNQLLPMLSHKGTGILKEFIFGIYCLTTEFTVIPNVIHIKSRFIDDLYTINDENEINTSLKKYPQKNWT